MVAVEFSSSSPAGGPHSYESTIGAPASGLPKPGIAARVAKKCIEKGMLILTTSVFEVVRFIPPLNISKEDMDKGLKIFAESVEEAAKEG
jgi:4-aminobutyrate aminotransferase